MEKDNDSEVCEVFERVQPDGSVRVYRSYGYIIRMIEISLDLQILIGGLTDSPKKTATWEELKRNPMEIPVAVLGFVADGPDLDVVSITVNTQTGALTKNGKAIGMLSPNPIDSIIEAIDEGRLINCVEMIEKSVWEYVNDNQHICYRK